MSATAKKQAMRGGGKPPSTSDDESQELTEQELEAFDASVSVEELSEEPEEEEDDKVQDLPLPHGVEEDENGDWVYTLQHSEDAKLPFEKIRIPVKILARDIRRSTQGRNPGETVFFMLCSVSKVPAKLMDKLDAKDYGVLSQLMERRALGNSRAVLHAIYGVRGSDGD